MVIFHSYVNVYQRVGEKNTKQYRIWGPQDSWGSHKWLNELWFMVDITIDSDGFHGVYKPTNITGGAGHPLYEIIGLTTKQQEHDVGNDVGNEGVYHFFTSSH